MFSDFIQLSIQKCHPNRSLLLVCFCPPKWVLDEKKVRIDLEMGILILDRAKTYFQAMELDWNAHRLCFDTA